MHQKFINCTPHVVSVQFPSGEVHSFPACGIVPRVQQHNVPVIHINDIPMSNIIYGEVENLPEPKENTYYIVSALVRERVPNRKDVISPDSGPSAIRNEKGQIEAVVGFICN